MARLHSKNLYSSFKGTVLTTDYRSNDEKRAAKLVDAGAGDDVGEVYLVGRKSGDMTIEFIDDSTHTAWDACEEGEEGALIWGEQGNGTGKPKHTVNALVESREKKEAFEDVIICTVNFKFSDAAGVADSTFA